MKNAIAKNISIFRKKQGLTQEELAKKLNVSFQAVSKWETGGSYPDISVYLSLLISFIVTLIRCLVILLNSVKY